MLDLTAMKWFKKQRENPDKVEAFAFADSEFWKNVDEQVLDIAMDNAMRTLEFQMEAYHQIVSTSGTLLGWLVGAFISLSAAVVALFSGGWTTALIMAVYGLACVIVPICIISLGIHFKQTVRPPGVQPRDGLHRGICSGIRQCSSSQLQSRYYKASLLIGFQRDIDYNEEHNLKRIRCYRCAAGLLGIELAAGLALFAMLTYFC